jgi:predicted porin
MCNRNSFIGVKGAFGSVNFGTYDTPAKRVTGMYDPFPISAAMGQGAQMWNATTTSGNGTAASGSVASFSRRQNNLITYDMPSMNGLDASFAWSATNEASAQTAATTIQKPRLWSAMVNYTNGPLGLGLGYESHHNYNPAGSGGATYTGGNDTMVSLAAGYKVSDALRLSGIWNSIQYDKVNAAGADMSVKTWALYADWNVTGPYRVRAGYSVQNSTSGSFGAGAQAAYTTIGSWTANGGAGDSGAQKIHLEGVQALSKRTELGLTYAQISNDRYSNITIGTGGATPNYGEKSTFMGMLIRHKF